VSESELSQRLDRLVQVVINRYLPALVGVMAEQGVRPEDQRERLDRFVRALIDWEVADRLTEDGRPVPAKIVEEDGQRIVFNRVLISQVSDAEMRQALRSPIQQLLGLPSMSVGLVLSIDDFDKLKRLGAKTPADTTIRLADVPAVIERRLMVFASRLNEFISRLGGPSRVIRSGLGPLRTHLTESADEWPGWDDLRDVPGVNQIIDRVDDGLPDKFSGPGPSQLVELFWESLDLSPTSFLRHAATSARGATNGPAGLSLVLEAISETLESEGVRIESTADQWPAFEELYDTWNELFRSEQRILSWTTEGRATPDIDLFEPPRTSLRMAEPDTLPWDYPLLCWTVRERDALRDLLEGTRETMVTRVDSKLPDGLRVAPWSLDAQPFEVDLQGTATFTTKIVEAIHRHSGGSGLVDPDIRRRALGACWHWLERKFKVLNVAEQRQLLETLRAGYDGFFGESSIIWNRRFQSCDTIDPVAAFRVLAGELRHLLGPTMLFDAFSEVGDPHPDRVPNFVSVVGMPEGAREIRFRIPLVALKSCWEEAPLVVRVVEVVGARTRWLDDITFTERSLLGEEPSMLIDSFEQDHVTMALRRLN
jgi:hypothetical protein